MNALSRLLGRITGRIQGITSDDLDEGLRRIGSQLGIDVADGHCTMRKQRTTADAAADSTRPVNIMRHPTAQLKRSIYYAPDMDGRADPGEIVWANMMDKRTKKPYERALVVIGRSREQLLGLMISPNDAHAEEDNWLDIGAGAWDRGGRRCWVRLDSVVAVPELWTKRQGAIIPRRRFDRIANRLRNEYGWY